MYLTRILEELLNGWLQLVSLCYIFLNGVNKMDTYFKKVEFFGFFLCIQTQKLKICYCILGQGLGEIKHNLYLNMEDVR